MVTAASRKPRAKNPSGTPEITPLFESSLRRRVDDDLRQLFNGFLTAPGTEDLDRCFLRDVLRLYVEGNAGLRTAFHTALESDLKNCYIRVPYEHSAEIEAFLDRLVAGNSTLKPIGAGWAIWKRPENTAGNGC
jgi:hypothetical protein